MKTSRTIIALILLIACIILMVKTIVLSATSVEAKVAYAQSVTRTPTPLIKPTPLRLYSSMRGQCSNKSTLASAPDFNLPIKPVPIQGTPERTVSPLSPPIPLFPTPSAKYLSRLGITSRLDGYAVEAAEFFKRHQQEGIEGLRKWLVEHNLRCVPNLCSNDLIAGDFDNDGRIEYILTLSLPRQSSSDAASCGSHDHDAQRVYLFSCQQFPGDCPVYRIGRLQEYDDSGACINSITDLNNDRQPDLSVTYHLCGASDCYDQLEIVSLSGLDHYNYLAPKIQVHNGCIAANDENGDGIVEIFASTSDFPGSVGSRYDSSGRPLLGPFQNYEDLYEWNGTEYILSGRAYSHHCLFHVIWDGIDWAKRGQPQTALAVFEIALTNQTIPLECKYDDNVAFPWRTYAQFAFGMLNAQLGRSEEAKSALMRLKNIDTEKIYTPLADVFLEAYDAGDYNRACEVLTAYVDKLAKAPIFRGPYGGRQATTFCPGDMTK